MITAAVEFARAYARPEDEVAARKWWAGVEPRLTAKARKDYAAVDPMQVWYQHVTGAGQLLHIPGVPRGTFYAVIVPTDQGQVRVELFTSPEGLLVAYIGAAK